MTGTIEHRASLYHDFDDNAAWNASAGRHDQYDPAGGNRTAGGRILTAMRDGGFRRPTLVCLNICLYQRIQSRNGALGKVSMENGGRSFHASCQSAVTLST